MLLVSRLMGATPPLLNPAASLLGVSLQTVKIMRALAMKRQPTQMSLSCTIQLGGKFFHLTSDGASDRGDFRNELIAPQPSGF